MADDALETAMLSLRADGGARRKRGAFGRKSPEERFDAMRAECLAWEEMFPFAAELDGATLELNQQLNLELDAASGRRGPGGDDRMLLVLKGCCEGARCPPVVEALRVCYLQYSPLRLGGDLIFKVLKRIVAAQTGA